jgi:uncharacterized tellurite resistance protein B-like protein
MIVLEQLKMLVNLAMADGNMSADEKNFIKNIGKAHGFPESSVETLFYEKHELVLPEKLSADQRFEYALNLFQLMKLDEKLFQHEIKFCGAMVEKLGYKKELVGELMTSVKKDAMSAEEIETLRKKAATYLIQHGRMF